MAQRKNPKRVAAGKKAAATRRKNTKSGTTRTTRTTRTTKKTTFLSEVTSRANIRAGGEMILQAAAGAAIANEVNKAMPNQSKLQRVGILAGLGYLAAVGGKMPNVGAGFAAIAATEFMKPEQPAMNENADYLEETDLNQLPDVVNMDENNPYAYMDESQNQNQYAYMSENPYDMYNLYM